MSPLPIQAPRAAAMFNRILDEILATPGRQTKRHLLAKRASSRSESGTRPLTVEGYPTQDKPGRCTLRSGGARTYFTVLGIPMVGGATLRQDTGASLTFSYQSGNGERFFLPIALRSEA